MNVLKHDRLFIRSSLLNTVWRQDGSRGDDIAVIPVQGGMADSLQEYLPPGDGGRTYEVKETVTGATSFSIRITDAEDRPIEFTTDYELTLAFFFIPAGA